MGKLKSSENSLNQHIKLKHPEFWQTIKDKSVESSIMEEEDDEYENN